MAVGPAKVPGPAHFHVVGIEPRGLQRFGRLRLEGAIIALSPAQGIPDAPQLAVQLRRGAALVRAQVAVAGTHGQPVPLPLDRAADHLDGKLKVADHAAQQHQLLKVLLPQHHDVGRDDAEQPQDHRRHAIEMPRTARGAQFAAQLGHRHLDRRLDTVRVDVLVVRRKNQVHQPLPGQQRLVVRQGARIGVEILAGPELRGIDEDAADDPVGMLARDIHQAQVPPVQIPHGGNQGHGLVGQPPATDQLAHRLGGIGALQGNPRLVHVRSLLAPKRAHSIRRNSARRKDNRRCARRERTPGEHRAASPRRP